LFPSTVKDRAFGLRDIEGLGGVDPEAAFDQV